MIYDILEAKLASIGLVEGETLFRGFLPAECEIGVMTRAPLQGIHVDPHIPNWYRTRMQVVTRHTDPMEGVALAARVMKILTVEKPEFYEPSAERGRAQLAIFFPETLPIQFPRLEGNGYEWSQHFTTTFGFEPLS